MQNLLKMAKPLLGSMRSFCVSGKTAGKPAHLYTNVKNKGKEASKRVVQKEKPLPGQKAGVASRALIHKSVDLAFLLCSSEHQE